MSTPHSFSLIQGGIEVASGQAPDFETAHREAMHYAMTYGQEGSVCVSVFPAPQPWWSRVWSKLWSRA